MKTLDTRKPYGIVLGMGGAASFEQNGVLFKKDGTLAFPEAEKVAEIPPGVPSPDDAPAPEHPLPDARAAALDLDVSPAGGPPEDPESPQGPAGFLGTDAGKQCPEPGCEFVGKTGAGLAMHRRRIHGVQGE